MVDYITEKDKEEEFKLHELTKIQREYVNKLYQRERGEHGINSARYRSVVFGKYKFAPGDDPFDLSRDWPIEEKKK